MGTDNRQPDQTGNYPPTSFEHTVYRELSIIRSDVARILEIMTGERPLEHGNGQFDQSGSQGQPLSKE